MDDLGTFQKNQNFISSRDAARMYRVTNDYIARLARRGKLQGKVEGRTWMIEGESLNNFFAHKTPTAPVAEPRQAFAAAPVTASPLRYVADEEPLKKIYVAPKQAAVIIPKRENSFFSQQKYLIGASALGLFLVLLFATPAGALLRSPIQNLAAVATSVESPFFSSTSFSNIFSKLFSFFLPKAEIADTQIAQKPVTAPTMQPTAPVVATNIPAVTTQAPAPTKSPVVQNITNPVVERVVEHTVERVTGGVTQEYVLQKLAELENTIKQQVFTEVNAVPPTYAGGGFTNNLALSQRIDKLDGVTITNATITGSSFNGASSFDNGGGGGGTGEFAFTPTNYGNATSTTIGFNAGLISVGSTTINGDLVITGTCTGCGGGSGDITVDGDNNIYSGTIGALSDLSGGSDIIALGSNAGVGATAANYTNLLGNNAGNGATSANNSNFFGRNAGQSATAANNSNFFGANAGRSATNASNATFFGESAGDGATNAFSSFFVGAGAGSGATNAAESIFIGTAAGASDLVDNTLDGTSIAIGRFSGTGGFSNSIALGHGVINSAVQQLNIGNILYATGIYNSDTQSAAPTSGNVGIGTENPLSTLDVAGNFILSGADRYINFNTDVEDAGYGFRDNGGTLEFKNDGGDWAAIASSSGSSGGGVTVDGSNNIFGGTDAFVSNVSGSQNIALGDFALNANDTGDYNIALGQSALALNTDGTYNLAIGAEALLVNTSGTQNVAFGKSALAANETGDNNIGLGYRAAQNLTNGDYNIAIGVDTNFLNSTGSFQLNIGNTIFGDLDTADIGLVSGTHFNFGVETAGFGDSGYGFRDNSGILEFKNDGGSWDTFGSGVTVDASDNIFGGSGALNNNAGGLLNTALGQNALSQNSSGARNIGIGVEALGLNETGDNNIGLGYQAGQNLTTGTNNIGIGAHTDFLNSSGSDQLNIGNTIYADLDAGNVGLKSSSYLNFGVSASPFGLNGYGFRDNGGTIEFKNDGGSWAPFFDKLTIDDDFNIFTQGGAFVSNVDGLENIALGIGTLAQHQSGNLNIAIGTNALSDKITGSSNIGLGAGSGNNLISGNNNIAIGNVQFASTTASNQLNIGNLLFGIHLDGIIDTLSSGNIGIASTSPFARLSVHANNGDINNTLFAIGSSTASVTSTLFSVSNTGLTTIGDASGVGDAIFQVGDDTNAWSSGYYATDKSYRIASSTTLSANVAFSISKGGNVGIASTSPWRTLSVNGTVALNGLTSVSGADASVCIDPVTKEVTTQAGDTCSASAARYKHDISSLEMSAVEMISELRPVSFVYNDDISSTTRWGFIADEAASTSPQLASFNADGTVQTINLHGILAVTVKAVQEIASLGTTFKNTLLAWLGDSTNGIADLFATTLHAEVLYAKTVHTDELCVGSVCVTEEQFLEIVGSSHSSPVAPPAAPVVTPPADDPPAETPPVETPASETPAPETPPADTPAPPNETPPPAPQE